MNKNRLRRGRNPGEIQESAPFVIVDHGLYFVKNTQDLMIKLYIRRDRKK